MNQQPISRAACRLHGLVIGLLGVQLLIGGAGQPLAWGGALLTLMAGLKLLESRHGQDLQRAGLAELVVLGVLAVIHPDLASSLIQLGTGLLVITALLCQEGGGRRSLRQSLQRGVQLGLAALPLIVLLFVLAPRIGPLWSVPGQQAARTGLSDRLDSGTISRLVQDPSPALRISYLRGGPPQPTERYWRVLVLDRFDGRRWLASPLPERKIQRRTPTSAPPPEQIWVAEPSKLAALPWSGRGEPIDPALSIQPDGVLLDGAGGAGRRRYGFRAIGAANRWQRLEPEPQDLSFIAGANPRLEALAAEWGRTQPAAERIAAARRLMQSEGLRYTLTPPTLPETAPLDALLFQTRAGFCEHFASAFTALMRAAGVPARVVIGYQGGDWVPGDRWGAGFLDIRQRDAHAWSEVWLPQVGWVQIDPTAWVAPERIESGTVRGLRQLPWWSGLERGWTRLDLAWTRWVLAFDGNSQARLLGAWQPWQGLLLMAGLAFLLLPLVWWLQHQGPSHPVDRQRRELERTLQRLGACGLQLQPGESLDRFCARAGAQLPSAAAELRAVAQAYAALRFAPAAARSRQIMGFRRACRALAIRLRRHHELALERSH